MYIILTEMYLRFDKNSNRIHILGNARKVKIPTSVRGLIYEGLSI